MKSWKKRWMVVEKGVLYYYVSRQDKEAGRPALGALLLVNATTTLEKRGKFKNTCFRVDLDLSQQMSSVLDTLEEGYAMEEGGSAAKARAKLRSTKAK